MLLEHRLAAERRDVPCPEPERPARGPEEPVQAAGHGAPRPGQSPHSSQALELHGFSLHAERDDGIGFDGSAIAGSGLQNMRDRLSALGGEVEIRSAPGEGTTVRGRVPLREDALT